MTGLVIFWALFVIGGHLGLKPGRCTRWNFAYQLPVNLFFGINRTISGMLDGDMSQTISSKMGRNKAKVEAWTDYQVGIFLTKTMLLKIYLYYLINTIALDPNHCRKYRGI